MLSKITPPTNYKTQSYDTTIAAEFALFDLWRSWNVQERATHLNQNTRTARSTAWYIAQTTLANQSKKQQIHYFLRKVLDDNWVDYLEIQGEIKMTGVIIEALIVAEILESLDIPYLVGGSVASGIWGEMRYTQDVDMVADLKESQINLVLNAFAPRFYISELAIKEAIELGYSFNLIDNLTGWKIDIFILTQDIFQQSKFQRRQQVSVDETGRTLYFSSPEDTILQKLLWYRMSEKCFAQQWRDVLGVLKLQKSVLDIAYLLTFGPFGRLRLQKNQQYAHLLELSEELEQAFRESNY